MQLLDGCLLLSILFIPCALVRQVGLKAWAVPPPLAAHIHFHLWGQFKIISFRKTALGYSQSNNWGEELEGIYRVHCVQLLDYFRASQKSKHILNGIIQTSLEHWKTWGINTIKVTTGTPGKLAHIECKAGDNKDEKFWNFGSRNTEKVTIRSDNKPGTGMQGLGRDRLDKTWPDNSTLVRKRFIFWRCMCYTLDAGTQCVIKRRICRRPERMNVWEKGRGRQK